MDASFGETLPPYNHLSVDTGKIGQDVSRRHLSVIL